MKNSKLIITLLLSLGMTFGVVAQQANSAKDSKSTKELNDAKSAKDVKDAKSAKDAKETKDAKSAKETPAKK